MGVIGKVANWIRGLFGLTQSIEDVFHVQIAVSPYMLQKQAEWRGIVAGRAQWNDSNTPSLRLASAVDGEIASRAAQGLQFEALGSTMANYVNEQIKPVIDGLYSDTISTCHGGEIIWKPFLKENGIGNVTIETDSYWPIAYNTRDELIDVIFGAQYDTNEYIYRLLERHTYNSELKTHTISYRAFRERTTAFAFTPQSLGQEVPVNSVPDWAALRGGTITNIDKPLFVLIRAPIHETFEKPQRQGVPPWTKAIDMMKKADKHEARTEWEFEGGELAVQASGALFANASNDKGKPKHTLPKGKERLFRLMPGSTEEMLLHTFNPEPRIVTYNQRRNDIFRSIEFLSGLSYGIISDNNLVDRTATEFIASKERLITTIGTFQNKIMEQAIRHLVDSFARLAEIQGIPQGNIELRFEWSEAYAINRKEETQERAQLTKDNLYFLDQFTAYYNEITLEEARAQLAERGVQYFGMIGGANNGTTTPTTPAESSEVTATDDADKNAGSTA